MRKAAIAIGVLALAAIVVVGALQAGGDDRDAGAAGAALTLAQVSRPIPGAPPELAALHRRVNELAGGGLGALDAQLRALRGHPVVVNLWASWCAPCRFELPFFQRQAVRQGARVAFLGVNVNDARDAARRFAARYPMPYPSFEDRRGRLLSRYSAQGLPVTAFYDAGGKLALVHQGQFPSERLLAAAIARYARS